MAVVKQWAGHQPVRSRLRTSLCRIWACTPETVTSATAALAAFCMPGSFITHAGWGQHGACIAVHVAALVWCLQLRRAYATMTTISATVATAAFSSVESAALCNLHAARHCQHHSSETSLHSYMHAGSPFKGSFSQQAFRMGTANSPVLVLAVWSTRLGLDSSAVRQRAYNTEGGFDSLFWFRTSRNLRGSQQAQLDLTHER